MMTLEEIEIRRDILFERLKNCEICPWQCRVNRLSGQIGKCRSLGKAIVSSASQHFGEEPPLVGSNGSGTIFFTNCNLFCIYCQNYDISRLQYGKEIEDYQLANMMLHLQELGCHNINLVSPTHFVPQIVSSLKIAIEKGLTIPIVYNTGGYDSVDTLKLLDGIIDIYMPDFKYWDNNKAFKYSGVKDYCEVAKAALSEMYRQVGDLLIDKNGIAVRGLLVRHLVLPNNLKETEKILEFIANNLSRNTYINIMNQYRPCFQAFRRPEINRIITTNEYRYAVDYALKLGLHRGINLD